MNAYTGPQTFTTPGSQFKQLCFCARLRDRGDSFPSCRVLQMDVYPNIATRGVTKLAKDPITIMSLPRF